MNIRQQKQLLRRVADDRYQEHYADLLQIGKCEIPEADRYADDSPANIYGITILYDEGPVDYFDYQEAKEALDELY